MKTLSKEITHTFFKDADHYRKFRAAWADTVNGEHANLVTLTHYMIYAMLQGKDWTKCIGEIKNKRKIKSVGYSAVYQKMLHSLSAIKNCANEKVKTVLIKNVPHVRQKPDFCGEACAEMYLKKLGYKGNESTSYISDKIVFD